MARKRIGTLRLGSGDYARDVPAIFYGDTWAVTQPLVENPPKRKFHITHVPTGEKVSRTPVFKRHAERVAQCLASGFPDLRKEDTESLRLCAEFCTWAGIW